MTAAARQEAAEAAARAAAARQEAEAAAARLAETLRQLQQSKG